MRESSDARAQLPVFLLFESIGGGRDVRFRGLLVPGSPLLHADEELNAVWRSEKGERFQNYRAKFTVLDVGQVTRAWIEDVIAGDPLSANAPGAWRQWVEHFRYRPAGSCHSPCSFRVEQLPDANDSAGWKLLNGVTRPSHRIHSRLSARLSPLLNSPYRYR